MCGICGKLYFDVNRIVEHNIITNMSNSMYHRGPDQSGYYVSKNCGLGHRRLNIIDLEGGKQPISNENDKIWIIFNGEIYNYKELRNQLLKKGHIFKTQSDTEVIIHLYEERGIDCLQELRGMFAFAILDLSNHQLFIARDRIGIKPLYYVKTNDSFLFASEIKALFQDPQVINNVNYKAMMQFLQYTYTPGPDTMFENIFKLQPGHYIIIKDGKLSIDQYWDIKTDFLNNPSRNGKYTDDLERLLTEAINLHMISDVPVGFLLSGGIDSTTALGLYLNNTNLNVKTFTIGFESNEFEDERLYAKMAANYYGVEYYETTIGEREFFDFLPKFIWHIEEPIFEPPAISLFYVSKMAKEHVKVLISGEGGDEAFAGYQTYRNLVWLERIKRLLGPPTSKIFSKAILRSNYFQRLQKYAYLLNSTLPYYYYSRSSNPNNTFIKNYFNIFSKEFLSIANYEGSTQPFIKYFQNINSESNLKQMLYVDIKTWLPDRLLLKADKITMANSLELRVPLLDHKLLEFAASLPDNQKLNGFDTKYVLKKVASKYIPEKIIKRKKAGFPTPYGKWLKNRKDFVLDILMDPKTSQRGYFNSEFLSSSIIKNWINTGGYSEEIFNLIILEYWHRLFIDR